MAIIKEDKLNVLCADEGMVLKSKEDNYEERHIDEKGNVIEEHVPYYFKKAYIPPTMTLEQAQEMYDEIDERDIIREREGDNNGSN